MAPDGSTGAGVLYDPMFLAHDLATHPENAGRLEAVVAALVSGGLMGRLARVPAQEATFEELHTVHTRSHVEAVRRISSAAGYMDPDTYTTAASFRAAAAAAGGLVDLTLSVCRGELSGGLALVRPPGHHAMRDRAMGFCLFGSVALAARAARDRGGRGRVAVVDFDVHHGNGTQDILLEDGDILFCSTHQYPHFPGTGALDETGRGAGAGATVNVPLPAGVGDDGFARIRGEILDPLLRRFSPDLILVSAGFDGHWRDPLAGLRLSLDGYDRMTRFLIERARELCGGRIVFALEGGYDLEVLPAGVCGVARALLDEETAPDPIGPAAGNEPDISRVIAAVRALHGLDRVDGPDGVHDGEAGT